LTSENKSILRTNRINDFTKKGDVMKRVGRLWVSVLMVVSLGVTLNVICPGKSAAATSHKPEGTVVVAVGTFGNEAFFPSEASAPELNLISGVWECLIHRKPGARELIPGLAERWTVADNGRTYTFFLRKGIPFHDNWGEFTAEDVKFSTEVVMKPESKSLIARSLRDNIASIEIINPYQVVFRCKTTWVEFPYMFASINSYVPMLSKKHVEKVGEKAAARHPVGTGPYKFVEWKVGESVKMEALESHWRQVPYFRTLILKVVPEESTRLAMLRTGEADIMDLSLNFKEEVERAGLKVLKNPDAQFCQIYLCGQILPTRESYDPKLPWVGDYKDPASQERAKKVRMALNLAVDRQAIVDSVFKGEAEIQAVPMFPKMWWPADVKPYPFDPARAKNLLTEAGYPNGFEMTLKLMSRVGSQEGPIYGEAVAVMWEKHLGIKVKRELVDFGVLRPLLAARKSPWAFTGDVTLWDEPFMLMGNAHTIKSPLLYGSPESEETTTLTETATTTFDAAKRRTLNEKIIKFYYDNYSTVPLCSKSATWGATKKIGGWELVRGSYYPHYFEYISPAK
jgi:peptide/nickel transport system substrate-binding protein